jgi:hypothetical protein
LRADSEKADPLLEGRAEIDALGIDRGREAAAGERQLIRERGRGHTGNLCQRRGETFLILLPRRARHVLPLDAGQLKGEQVLGIEPRRRPSQPRHVREEHGAHREQHERQRNLGDDQRPRQAARSRAGGGTALIEDLDRLGAARLPERREARRRAGDDREADGKQDDAAVERDLVGARNEVGGDREDDADEPDADERADDSPGEGDEQSLEEVVEAELSASGAERDANRGFTLPRYRAREQKARDAGAGEQEQQPGGHRRENQDRFDAEDRRGADFVEDGGIVRNRPGIQRRNRRRRAPDIIARLRRRDPGSQPHVAEVHAQAGVLAPAEGVEPYPEIGLEAVDAGTVHGKPEVGRHHAGDCEGPAVERERLADDRRVRSQAPPQGVGEHDAGVVSEPRAERRTHGEPGDERRRDFGSRQVLRFAGVRHVVVAGFQPAEDIEAAGALLVLDQVAERVRAAPVR